MLRRAGLHELISSSEEEYLEKALRLIHDDRWRAEMTGKIQSVDLAGTVFSDAEAPSFKRAVDFLIANHDRLKGEVDRKPIRIL
jgi:predicted O-linked N-acetylglucosamine transferase (SPINDLY family)